MFAEILTLEVFSFMLVFSRVGGTLMAMPGFGSSLITPRFRLMVALFLALVTTPLVAHLLPPKPAGPLAMGILIVGEALVGIFIGAIAQAIIGTLHTAGTIISFTSSIANAMIFDPISQQQGAVVAGFFGTLAAVLLFVTNMHHLMIEAVIDSYTLFLPGNPLPAGDMANLLSRTISDSFKMGFQLAAPFLVVSFSFNLIMGLLSRLMPQLQVFFIGMPLQIAMAFFVMMIVLSSLMMVFLRYFEDGIRAFLLI